MPIRFHRFQQIARLKTDAFQRRAGKLSRARVARKTVNRTARFGIPIRRTQSGKRRHHIQFLAQISLFSQRLGFRCLSDHLKPITQPLHHSPRNENRPFQRIRRFAIKLIRNRSEQSALRPNQRVACVQQGKTARAIG